jgi:hypothetical protein
MVGKIKVLFFAANPKGMPHLSLDEDIRAIMVKLRAAEHRDSVEIVPFLAARPDDLLQGLSQHKPQIVHFSGHGSRYGEIVLADALGNPKTVPPQALTALFKALKDNVRVVLLSACWSKIQALAIAEVIDCVVGMNAEIEEAATIDFVSSFYRAIGFNRTVQEAFDQACVATLLEGHLQNGEPQLITRVKDGGNFRLLTETTEAETKIDPVHILKMVESNLFQEAYDEALAHLEKIADDSTQLPRKQLLKAVAFLKGRSFNVLNESERTRIENLLISSSKNLENSSLPYVILAVLEIDYYSLHGMRGASNVTVEVVRRKLQENNLSPDEMKLLNLVKMSDRAKTFIQSR